MGANIKMDFKEMGCEGEDSVLLIIDFPVEWFLIARILLVLYSSGSKL
jgi:hypothetical protein